MTAGVDLPRSRTNTSPPTGTIDRGSRDCADVAKYFEQNCGGNEMPSGPDRQEEDEADKALQLAIYLAGTLLKSLASPLS